MERVRPLAAVVVDLAAVVFLAPLGIAEDVEGGGDFLEPVLGLLVVRVAVGMVLFGKLTEGGANFSVRRLRGEPEHDIGVPRQVRLFPY